MSHHNAKVALSTYGLERRLRRDRKRARSQLTKGRGRYYNSNVPEADPDGAPPSEGWVLTCYPMERNRRRDLAWEKRQVRRAVLRRERLSALADGLETLR